MSIVGILSSNLFAAAAHGAHNSQNDQNSVSKFQQVKTEFQQLGQDLQSGNLAQAQSDFATLSQNFTSATPGATTNAISAPASANTASQALAQLGQDIQSGNLPSAQQDYANLQQDLQQISSQQVRGNHHHHHHHEESSRPSSRVSSQQANSISQAFNTLAQDLQSGNLPGAQTAFATLQNDLQQIGGFLPAGSNNSSGAGSVTTAASAAPLNVTA